MSPLSRFAVRFIETYRKDVAHRFAGRCRFQPGCSEYGLEAFEKYGFAKALRKTLWRVARCNRWYRGALIDPP